MSAEHEIDDPAGADRRQFLKRMAALGFAAPVVASFSMLSSTPAFALTLGSGGGGNGTTSDGATSDNE